MRVVEWDEFRLLPSGTVFQEINPNTLGDVGSLNILGSFVANTTDFVHASLLPQHNDPSVLGPERMAKLGLRADEPVEVIFMPSGFGRDGTFSHEGRRWLVWDKDDRERLARWLLSPEEAGGEQNGGPVAFVRVDA